MTRGTAPPSSRHAPGKEAWQDPVVQVAVLDAVSCQPRRNPSHLHSVVGCWLSVAISFKLVVRYVLPPAEFAELGKLRQASARGVYGNLCLYI